MSNLVITARDKKILFFLFENKVSTRKEIYTFFFKKESYKTANLRIRKLINEKYISTSAEEVEGVFIRYLSVGKRGQEVVKMWNNQYPIKKIERSESIHHDLELLNLRYILLQSPKIRQYYTENILQGIPELKNNDKLKYFVTLNSDAAILLNLKVGEFLVALEYETFAKSDCRYERKIRDYYNSNISFIIYVTRTDSLGKKLMEIDDNIAHELKRPNKVFLATYSNLLSNPKKLIFVNSKGKVLDLLS